MHIPDGYLSPQTNAVLGIASILTLAGAVYKTSRTVQAKYVPLLSIGAAFSFTIMMFNIPVPDGTTAHAVGGSLLAILLGPWAAMIGVSVALVIQALFFGDGGILALGANIFNMGIVLPFVSYFLYRVIAGYDGTQFKRQRIAAAIAGFIGLIVSALCAGVEFGLQPLLFHSASGMPLYSPYGLNVAVPAMLLSHLTIAGPVEGLVSALVVAYLQRSNPELLQLQNKPESVRKLYLGRLVTGILILALLTPLGLLASGKAWGEWGGAELQARLGYIPEGMQRFGDLWSHSLLANYSLKGLEQTFWQQAFGYLLSALAGLLIIGLIAFALQRIHRKGDKRRGITPMAPRK